MDWRRQNWNNGQGTLQTFKQSCQYAPGTTGSNTTDEQTTTTPR